MEMHSRDKEEESDLAVVGEVDVDVAIAGESAATSPVMMDKERQIPVDPVSLRHLGMVADEDSPLSAPSVMTELVVRSSSPQLPPLRRPTFVAASLPCSANSSPVHAAGAGAAATAPTPSPTATIRALARQHSVALAHYVVGGAASPAPALSRSASRAEGRSMVPHDDDDDGEDTKANAGAGEEDGDEGGFNCGALCMFIPGFNSSKKKPAAAAVAAVSSMRRQHSIRGQQQRRASSVSRLASLERFECGSWSPPPPPPAQEMSSCGGGEEDTETPVKMAFVFESGEPRGILKKSASTSRQQEQSARPSSASQRHVRFSTAAAAASCPTSPCVTPRLARARAEFNAFLEAQSA
uniref:Uncharacterized protein n=1 Tax=Leersia perrieri TaxID=77586 RepID=A0A0D9WRF0_9ORYZ